MLRDTSCRYDSPPLPATMLIFSAMLITLPAFAIAAAAFARIRDFTHYDFSLSIFLRRHFRNYFVFLRQLAILPPPPAELRAAIFADATFRHRRRFHDIFAERFFAFSAIRFSRWQLSIILPPCF